MQRANVFMLQPTRRQDKILRSIGEGSASMWNKINYYRRQTMFGGDKIDWNVNFYQEHNNIIGSAVSQQIIRKNMEAWKSFFALCKLKQQGKLPPDMKVKPPAYWKDRRTQKKKLIIIERNDMYCLKGQSITFPTSKKIQKEYGIKGNSQIKIRFKGNPKWSGKQGRLEIIFDELKQKWYVYQSVEVEETLHQPKVNGKKAYIDLGVKNLIASITPESKVIYSGRSILADWWYWNNRIAKHQSELKKVNGKESSKQLSKLYLIRKRRFRHSVNTLVRKYVKQCDAEKVGTIVVGDVRYINTHGDERNAKTNSMVNNFWSYKFITDRLRDVSAEYGMKVEFIDESYTSRTCPKCSHKAKSNRKHRGLFVCKKCGHTDNADMNGAENIRKKYTNTCNPTEMLISNNRSMARPTLFRWQNSTWESRISCL